MVLFTLPLFETFNMDISKNHFMCVLKANMSRLLCVYSKHRNGFYVCMTNIEAFTIICETAVTTNQPLKNIANYLALFVHLGAGRGEEKDEE